MKWFMFLVLTVWLLPEFGWRAIPLLLVMGFILSKALKLGLLITCLIGAALIGWAMSTPFLYF